MLSPARPALASGCTRPLRPLLRRPPPGRGSAPGAAAGQRHPLSRRGPEVSRRRQPVPLVASCAAGYFFGYPAWFCLWKGGFLPEPMHGALFGIFYACFILGFIYNRLRS